MFAIKVDMILSKAHETDSCNFFRNVQVRIRCAGKVPASDLLTESIHVTGVYFIISHFIMQCKKHVKTDLRAVIKWRTQSILLRANVGKLTIRIVLWRRNVFMLCSLLKCLSVFF